MAHQIFVSYATEDAETAFRVCALLEADGIQCWVAPRDVKAGTDYAAAIMNAIRSSQLVVLIFSTHSNASPYALREIDRAVAYQRPVLALRVDDTVPNSSIEYYVNAWQRLDALEGVEDKRAEIVATVRRQLAQPSAAVASSGEASGSGTATSRRRPAAAGGTAPKARGLRGRGRKTWVVAAAAVVVVAAVALGLGLGLTRDRAASQGGTTGGHISWSQMSPSGTLPFARDAPALAYDPTSGRPIMFGGSLGTKNGKDTWAYDSRGNTWAQLIPSGTAPSARRSHSMAYDPATHRLLMFGGFADTGSPLNDIWTYDSVANSWAELEPPGAVPSPRAAPAMAHDPVSQRLIVFGGFVAVGPPLADTWAYDPVANTWTELKPGGAVPPACGGGSMAYDPVGRRLIMFGGLRDTGSPLNGTWAYDSKANTWTELEPKGPVPSARYAHAMAYDLTAGRLIMFGGQDLAGTCLDDAWAYDSAANTWTELEPLKAQARPAARAGHAMVYDPASGLLLVFGGHSREGSLNDTWTCAPG